MPNLIARRLISLVAVATVFSLLNAQQYTPPLPSVQQSAPAAKAQAAPKIPHPNAPPTGESFMRATVQDCFGSKCHLSGKAEVETDKILLQGDEIDYDRDTGLCEVRGNAHLTAYVTGEQLWAERIDYNVKIATGTFYAVRGSAYGKIEHRPGVLTTGNPFLFKADWAERMRDRYVLHKAVLTNCEEHDPWWTLQAPLIDLIPHDRALAYRAKLKLRGVPLLYAPVLYKDLSDGARKSGFLTPSIGHSSRRGFMIGAGYYWAINRSYDLMYRPQYFTTRGLAHTIDFRGKPTQNSDFNAYIYGVNDKGELQKDGTRIKQGGFIANIQGRVQLPKGFYARTSINYLSNFAFRQAFTESFNEALVSEANSIGYVSRDWSTFHFNTVFTRQENFQSSTKGDTILVRKLPQFEFDSRDREISTKVLPVWVSWSSSAGLLKRSQPLFQTRNFMERFDVEPRIGTALRWKDIALIPSFSFRDTYYGSSFATNPDGTPGTVIGGTDLNRFTRQFAADLVLPSLVRVFDAPTWMGRKVKHSIEPRVSYKLVDGVARRRSRDASLGETPGTLIKDNNGPSDYVRIIRFDETELLSNTSEVEISLANRLWTKDKNGQVRDWLSWEVRQRRFFDPTFGGAVASGRRNVLASSAELTAYAFIDQARNYSPVVNTLRAQPLERFGFEWRGDYDPLRGRFTNSSVTADARFTDAWVTFGHNKVSCVPLVSLDPSQRETFCASAPSGQLLAPASNQLRGTIGWGGESRRGWNMGMNAVYDYSSGILQYANTQLTYNTSCCAFSGQFRRFNFGTRNENQYRIALVIANIGSFGTLKRQDRLF